MRRHMATIFRMLVIASLAVAAAAQHVPIGTLEGIVLDGQGKPVADASVTIQTSDGLHPHAKRTDAEGQRRSAGRQGAPRLGAAALDRWRTSRADRAGGAACWAGNGRGSHPGHRPRRGRHVRALPGPRQALTAHRARHLGAL